VRQTPKIILGRWFGILAFVQAIKRGRWHHNLGAMCFSCSPPSWPLRFKSERHPISDLSHTLHKPRRYVPFVKPQDGHCGQQWDSIGCEYVTSGDQRPVLQVSCCIECAAALCVGAKLWPGLYLGAIPSKAALEPWSMISSYYQHAAVTTPLC
jgi:hypothetical protein